MGVRTKQQKRSQSLRCGLLSFLLSYNLSYRDLSPEFTRETIADRRETALDAAGRLSGLALQHSSKRSPKPSGQRRSNGGLKPCLKTCNIHGPRNTGQECLAGDCPTKRDSTVVTGINCTISSKKAPSSAKRFPNLSK